MKTMMILYGFFSFALTGGSNFYNQRLQTIDGNTINTSIYQGKRVVIVVINATTPNVTQLQYLDSIENSNALIKVIAIPTEDFGAAANIPTLNNLQKTTGFTVTTPLKVKKNGSQAQSPLFSWLTNSVQNTHFDNDADGEGQLFIVSEKGTLFAVLAKNAPLDVVGKVINQPFSE